MDHDRFSRNLPEALMKIKTLENKFNIKVLATNESPDLDTNDPDVFLQCAFKYLMANNELLRIRQRTSRGIRQALEGGRFVNQAPYGYINRKEEGRKGVIVLDKEKAPIIRKIFFDFLLGQPIAEIYREATKLGFSAKSNSAITRVLTNCVYAGLVKVPASSFGPEKYIKGIHEGVISVADYWRCQEFLGRKAPLKTLPNNKVPLRGILRHTCGSHMTAGYSKGKRKYYLYYRCQKCSSYNISGEEIHEKFRQILELLSLSSSQINYISKHVSDKIKEALNARKVRADQKKQELEEVTKKIDSLEEKLINDKIEPRTYEKWYKRLNGERASLENEIQKLNKVHSTNWGKVERLLPSLTYIPGLFEKADIYQKHSILKEVFKGGLMFRDGAFRTPYINPALSHNSLILKEKRLLFVEQPFQNFHEITMCSEIGS